MRIPFAEAARFFTGAGTHHHTLPSRASAVVADHAKVIKLTPVMPILLVEKTGIDAVPLSLAVRNAGFINPLIYLPDDDSVQAYLDGTGIYSNRKQHPFPALALQDLSLPTLDDVVTLPWLERPQPCRYVAVTVACGRVEPWHFESAIAFGRDAILCKLQFPDSLEAMFQVLQGACIED